MKNIQSHVEFLKSELRRHIAERSSAKIIKLVQRELHFFEVKLTAQINGIEDELIAIAEDGNLEGAVFRSA
jgi:aspartyl aminopeptidase